MCTNWAVSFQYCNVHFTRTIQRCDAYKAERARCKKNRYCCGLITPSMRRVCRTDNRSQIHRGQCDQCEREKDMDRKEAQRPPAFRHGDPRRTEADFRRQERLPPQHMKHPQQSWPGHGQRGPQRPPPVQTVGRKPAMVHQADARKSTHAIVRKGVPPPNLGIHIPGQVNRNSITTQMTVAMYGWGDSRPPAVPPMPPMPAQRPADLRINTSSTRRKPQRGVSMVSQMSDGPSPPIRAVSPLGRGQFDHANAYFDRHAHVRQTQLYEDIEEELNNMGRRR